MSETRKVVSYVFLVAVAVAMFVPFLWSLSTSLKTGPEAALFPPTIVPEQPALAAYGTVGLGAPFLRWLLNSA